MRKIVGCLVASVVGALIVGNGTAFAASANAVRGSGTVTAAGSWDAAVSCSPGSTAARFGATLQVAPQAWTIAVDACMSDVHRPQFQLDGTFTLTDVAGDTIYGVASGGIGVLGPPFNTIDLDLFAANGSGAFSGFAGTLWVSATVAVTGTTFSATGVSYGGYGPGATTQTRDFTAGATLVFAGASPDASCASGMRDRATGSLSRAGIRDWHFLVDGCVVLAAGGEGIPTGVVSITTGAGTTMAGTGLAFRQANGTWAAVVTLSDSSREFLGGRISMNGSNAQGAANGVLAVTRSPIG